jgi:single-strand DNA-binding protein
MAKGRNVVELLGNVGKPPELKDVNGQALLKFSLATPDGYKGKDGQWVDVTDWHNVVVWGKMASTLSPYIAQGSKLFIEGKLKTRSYEKNGEKRYTTEVVARDIVLCGEKKERSSAPADTVTYNHEEDDNIPF